MSAKKITDALKSKLFSKEYDDTDYIELDDDISEELEDFGMSCYPENIIEVVLTGGPCSGKSELVGIASEELKKKNIPVFVVHETATDLLRGNLVFSDEPVEFQKAVCSVQLARERAVKDYACTYLRNRSLLNAVIIYDRSAWDGRAYIDDDEWIKKVFRKYNVYGTLGNRFVIHLGCAATVGKFSKENNNERYEDDETAAKIDKRLFDIYRTHPYFAHIPARESFEQKKEEFLKVLFEHVEKRLVAEKKDK